MTEDLRNLLSVASPILLGLVTWFLRGVAADIRENTRRVEALVLKSELHDARIVTLERESAHYRVLVDDMRGFLATQGFRKRDS